MESKKARVDWSWKEIMARAERRSARAVEELVAS